MAVLNPAVTEGEFTETLKDLRDRVLIRLGFAAQLANPPPGMILLINDFLSGSQKQIAQRFPALVTERFYTWTMEVGTRFYSVSGDDEGATTPDFILDPLKISWVGVEDLNGAFIELSEGISPRLYTTIAKNGFPRFYEIRQSIEVYPAPNDVYKLQIKGRPKNFAFTSDTDVATVDPELVFLLALASAKTHYEQSDASTVFTQATSHLGQLISGTHGTKRYIPHAAVAPTPQKPTLITFLQ